MTCAELEILSCDYVDGTLSAADRAAVESHLSACPACAELVRDAQAAVAFMERVAAVEPPPELVTRILYKRPWEEHRSLAAGVSSRLGGWQRKWLGGALRSILQPRFVMGMAMTILSFSMLSRLVPVRNFEPEDLQPARVWAALEDRGYRVWARSVKYYENLKFVYSIQSTLREWQQQQEEEQRLSGDAGAAKPDERRLPVSAPAQPAGSAGEQGQK